MADRALYEQAKAASDLTGIPVSRIYDQGVRMRLEQLSAELARLDKEAEAKLCERRRGGGR